MKNIILSILLFITIFTFSQTQTTLPVYSPTAGFENVVVDVHQANFDRSNPLKSNNITGYRLYKAVIEDKDSDALFEISGHSTLHIGRDVKYVLFSSFQNEVIDYFDSLWKFDYYCSYSKIVAHDLSSNFILLEHDPTKAVNMEIWVNGAFKDTMQSYDNKYIIWDNVKHQQYNGRSFFDGNSYSDINDFYWELGFMHYFLGEKDYFNALYCLRKAYEINNCTNPTTANKTDLQTDIFWITECKLNLKDYYGCIEYCNQYLHSGKKGFGGIEQTQNTYNNLMKSYFYLGKFDKAIVCADSIMKIKTGQQESYQPAFAHKIKGMALFNIGKKDKGCEELGLAMELGDRDALQLINKCCNNTYTSQITLNDEKEGNNTESDKKAMVIPLIRGTDELFKIEAELNGTIKLKFILDSGASDVSIPPNIVKSLIYSGTLTEGDFTGEQKYILADGTTIKSASFIIHKLKVGELIFEDVKASVGSSDNAPLLLGQNILKKFGTVTLDYYNNKLIIK